MRCKGGPYDFLKIYSGSLIKLGEIKNPYLMMNRLFCHLDHHYSPSQTLDVLQVIDVPRKTCCPELRTSSRQSVIRTVSKGSISSSHRVLYPFSTESKIIGIFLMATSCFCFIWSLCSWLFSHWLLQIQVSTSLVSAVFYSLKFKFIPVKF